MSVILWEAICDWEYSKLKWNGNDDGDNIIKQQIHILYRAHDTPATILNMSQIF